MISSRYSNSEYSVSFDQSLAERFKPITYDPYMYGSEHNPVAYFRVVESGTEKCIQYYYYWDKQDCTKSYLITEPNTTGFILGSVIAILELVAANLLAPFIPGIFLLPWWAHFILFFLGGSYLGYRYNNEVGDALERPMGIIVGRFFTHEYDFEPIFLYLRDLRLIKAVISGRGDVDAMPHRNDIFADQNSYSQGESFFVTSEEPIYPNGLQKASTSFKEFSLEELVIDESKPSFAIIACYHAFTARRDYYDENVFVNRIEPPLRSLSDEVLDEWYKKKHFGHDVADPFGFPYLKFAKPPGIAQYNRRGDLLGLLAGLALIMDGLIRIKRFIFALFRR